jgi:hypothetical protein
LADVLLGQIKRVAIAAGIVLSLGLLMTGAMSAGREALALVLFLPLMLAAYYGYSVVDETPSMWRAYRRRIVERMADAAYERRNGR